MKVKALNVEINFESNRPGENLSEGEIIEEIKFWEKQLDSPEKFQMLRELYGKLREVQRSKSEVKEVKSQLIPKTLGHSQNTQTQHNLQMNDSYERGNTYFLQSSALQPIFSEVNSSEKSEGASVLETMLREK